MGGGGGGNVDSVKKTAGTTVGREQVNNKERERRIHWREVYKEGGESMMDKGGPRKEQRDDKKVTKQIRS